ncbi:MAG TPA: bifunctional 5,10-methylenetetrahydrofolate dehydrogenase/5,10-methenyltetrahydrofolate cyclohydrolase [Candidatus Omnitrophota bacterium]|nr:bifunctional 5,10-methylenetetrahydrofolate dehydrogenase/5,10-methenyltetrahydrofolate cyclohydrolase [Candidatus Omnitrophota bacterium]
MAKLLEGKLIADQLKNIIKSKVLASSRRLKLSSIQVGVNPASDVYIKSQKKNAELLGIEYDAHTLEKETSEERLIEYIQKLNDDASVSGIIVQMPLPLHMDYKKISQYIKPEKDVEGMHPVNMGKIIFGKARILPCTAAAVMELLNSIGIHYSGKEAVIVGHSEIVGKPLALTLLDKLATVTVCHIGTSKAGKLEEHVRRADILIVAVGRAGLIKGDWVKEKAVVIDVGINRVGDKIVGDVEFEEAEKRASFITPVPGGVGPLTVTMLMRNLVEAAGI